MCIRDSKKGVGSSKNGRESQSKRLGVKLFGGEVAKAGNIIVRQREMCIRDRYYTKGYLSDKLLHKVP